MKAQSPILIRIFKTENVLEIWKPSRTGKYAKLTSFEICKWSGKLGPKFKEGDRQAPEGFYTVAPRQMNPNSAFHLSFNMGFPNSFDRSRDRTGTHLMIHGACSSAGCYSMNDDQVEAIYALAREAFKGGQKRFQIQAFPFRMTAKNLAKHVDNEHFEFWKMLKEGYDHFELTKRPPKVDVCGRRYVFNQQVKDGAPIKARAECPVMGMPKSLAVAFSERQIKENDAFQSILKWQNKPQSLALASQEVLSGSLLQNAIVPKPKAVAVPKQVAATVGPKKDAPLPNASAAPANPVAGGSPIEDTYTGAATASPIVDSATPAQNAQTTTAQSTDLKVAEAVSDQTAELPADVATTNPELLIPEKAPIPELAVRN